MATTIMMIAEGPRLLRLVNVHMTTTTLNIACTLPVIAVSSNNCAQASLLKLHLSVRPAWPCTLTFVKK